MDDLTSTNVATIASSESPCSTWIEKQPTKHISKLVEKIESKKTAHSHVHVPRLLVQRGKSQNRFSPAAPDRQGASDTWLTTINGVQRSNIGTPVKEVFKSTWWVLQELLKSWSWVLDVSLQFISHLRMQKSHRNSNMSFKLTFISSFCWKLSFLGPSSSLNIST